MGLLNQLAFILDTSGDLPRLSVVAGRSKREIPDYRLYSGAARRALQEFSLLHKKQSLSFTWDRESENEENTLYDPGGRMISAAAAAGLLKGSSGRALVLQPETCRIMVSVSPEEEGAYVIRPELREGKESGESVDSHSKLKAVAPDYVVMGEKLFPCEDLGVNWQEVENVGKRVGREELPLYLSLILSRFPGLGIDYQGFRTINTPSRTAVPGLLFQEIDAYGFLHILPVSSLPGYPPGFFEEQEIINVVEIEEQEKEVLLSEVIFPISPVETFRTLIKKEGKTVRDQVMEEDGRFILSPEYAGDFLGRNMGKLVTTFSLFEAEKLTRYKIRHLNPSVKLKLNHGIDFFEGTASVQIDETSWSWSSFLAEYRKHGCISLPDSTRVFPSPASVERFERLIRLVKGSGDEEESQVEISFFDLMMFNLKEEIEAPPDLRRRIESFYLGFNTLHQKGGDYSLAESELRPYQIYGVQWMEHLCDHEIGGCLADEMGLGKTVQVISLLKRAFQGNMEGPALIIAPRSLIWNWAKELERFAPELPVSVHYGPGRSNVDIDRRQKQVILTTYSITRIDIEGLAPIEFSYLILDESQHIKNLYAKRTMAILSLKARHRLALSGTPVENNLSELYSLFRFLNPSFFGGKAQFSREYGKPIQEEKNEQVLKELKRKIYPFMLRRLKQNVLKELPEKSEQTLEVELDAEHLEIYHRRRLYLKEKIREAVEKQGFFKSSFLILQAMAELRRLAGIPEEDGEYPGRSAKREQLIEMIGDIWENGHKCLVFTNFLAAVETISTDLEKAGVPNLVMTGATVNRQELVHRFQTDPEIGAFVMTLKTGGVGLNLTAADYVFIYDPWWNRAAENQAVDRTHRIGQQNPVFAYRIIAKDTIEEKMLELQQQKAELASAILSSDSEAMKALSEEDLQFLLED
ncbi:MAG: DEAD/DEAH box helicase [Spirochaetota bacterium]|nr:DEAD/DEAH box helicase [Spirochaetota bacterium]